MEHSQTAVLKDNDALKSDRKSGRCIILNGECVYRCASVYVCVCEWIYYHMSYYVDSPFAGLL